MGDVGAAGNARGGIPGTMTQQSGADCGVTVASFVRRARAAAWAAVPMRAAPPAIAAAGLGPGPSVVILDFVDTRRLRICDKAAGRRAVRRKCRSEGVCDFAATAKIATNIHKSQNHDWGSRRARAAPQRRPKWGAEGQPHRASNDGAHDSRPRSALSGGVAMEAWGARASDQVLGARPGTRAQSTAA